MRTDAELLREGMKILTEHLGIEGTERFVAIIRSFDYTKWRQNLFQDMPSDVFLENARRCSESLNG